MNDVECRARAACDEMGKGLGRAWMAGRDACWPARVLPQLASALYCSSSVALVPPSSASSRGAKTWHSHQRSSTSRRRVLCAQEHTCEHCVDRRVVATVEMSAFACTAESRPDAGGGSQQLQVSFATGPESTATAELGAQIVAMDDAVCALAERISLASFTAATALRGLKVVDAALTACVDNDAGMRGAIPRCEWTTEATAKSIIEMQKADEDEVARSPRAADISSCAMRLDLLTQRARPATTSYVVDPTLDQRTTNAKVAESQALAAAEVAEVADARVAKVREDGAEELRQLKMEHVAAVHRYQTEIKELKAAARERDSTFAERDYAHREKEAKFNAELQALHEELERRDRLHAEQLAAAARLEDRWRSRIREAQRMRHGRGLRARAVVSGEQHHGCDEEIFVCYLCQKGVISL